MLSSRAATTGLAVRAQMLLTKDLTALTPRTPRMRDAPMQQQQQQRGCTAEECTAGAWCSSSSSAARQDCLSGDAAGSSSRSSSMSAGKARCLSGSNRPTSGAQRGNRLASAGVCGCTVAIGLQQHCSCNIGYDVHSAHVHCIHIPVAVCSTQCMTCCMQPLLSPFLAVMQVLGPWPGSCSRKAWQQQRSTSGQGRQWVTFWCASAATRAAAAAARQQAQG